MNSLRARKNSLPRRKELPAPTAGEIREFAGNALKLRRELTPGIAALAGNLQKIPAKFPADKEREDQARSCLSGSLDMIRILETSFAGKEGVGEVR